MPQRYTTRPLPPYRFIPGQTPHPVRDPKGHSYKKNEPIPSKLDPERWHESTTYLYGVDLFNAGYFWEAHETWEQIWKLEDSQSVVALFLQGLIQVSASAFKELLGTKDGSEKLLQNGINKLKQVQSQVGSHYMGVDLENFIQQPAQSRTLSIEFPDSAR